MSPQNIAKFLRAIPQSNQDAIALDKLATEASIGQLHGYALLLETLGAVTIDDNLNIKAASQTAKYMLHSLASYVENNQQLIDDWKTRGVYRRDAGTLQSGATLLYEMEKRRLSLFDNPTPSRIEEVAQVLIKRKNPETGQAEFLMQYDNNADQFQFIGGRRSPNDATLLDTVIREIDEEVVDSLVYQEDYQLELVVDDLTIEATLSPTFGALTEYHFYVYHLTGLHKPLTLQDNDKWVHVSEVISGEVNHNGKTVTSNNNAMYQQIDHTLNGGLEAITDSFASQNYHN